LAQEKVHHASVHDGMTGLVNRSRFTEEFDRLSGEGSRLIIMLVDVDHFKAVNDNYGHGAGDAVLQSVANRLKSSVRETDVVARLGGDEFAVLIKLKNDAGPEQTRLNAEKVLGRMREQLLFKQNKIDFSVSIGACEVKDETDLETALSRADFALYKAKNDGRAKYCIYDATIARELEHSRKLQSLVACDTYADKLTLFFQPIVCLKTRVDYCYEALIRWSGDQADYLTPSEIIQAAERNGSITRLGDWVLHEALKAHRSWQTKSRIAVNLSPRQLGSGAVIAQVKNALEHWGTAPSSLELEVTETALLQDEKSIDELYALKNLGVQIALDDFGTGYSSLTLLQRFPFDKLKIDRAFIGKVDADQLSQTIAGTVVSLGSKLDIETVAEGIETEQHLDIVKSMGCAMGQGFLLGKPQSGTVIGRRAMEAGDPLVPPKNRLSA
ncbi:MAG: EAL domain-containing protein, partial [Pseudomonadota bacterium]